jgi:hypothetical protein
MFGLSRFIPMIAHGSVMHVKLKLWLPMNWSTASFAPTADGAVRWIRDLAFPVHDALGRVIRVAGVAEEVVLQLWNRMNQTSNPNIPTIKRWS